jgi:hypothetical protein
MSMRDDVRSDSLDALIDDTARAMTAGEPPPHLRAAVTACIDSRGGRWRAPAYAMAVATIVLALAGLWHRSGDQAVPVATPQRSDAIAAETPRAEPAAQPEPVARPVEAVRPRLATAERLDAPAPPLMVEPLEVPELAVSEIDVPPVTVDALPAPPALP